MTSVAPGQFEHLMIPGPCRLDPDEEAILAAPIAPHYGAAWMTIYAKVLDDLAHLLGAEHAYLLPGSGSAGLDAAVFNLFEPGQTVVAVDSGYFGSRLVEMARVHGLDVRVVPCVPGLPVDPALVAEQLPGAHGLLVTHVETSTGVRHPVELLAKLAHDAGAVIMVDAISAAGGEHIHMAHMGIDALVSASQKGLGGAAGLAVVALTAGGRDRIRARSTPPPTWYLDLTRWDHAARECHGMEPTPVTVPTTLIQVLGSSLARIRAMGVDTWLREYEQLAADCRAGVRELGLRVAVPDEYAANMVVVVTDPRADAVRARLAANGIMLGGGLRPLEDNTFRIGLVGRSASPDMVKMVLQEIGQAL